MGAANRDPERSPIRHRLDLSRKTTGTSPSGGRPISVSARRWPGSKDRSRSKRYCADCRISKLEPGTARVAREPGAARSAGAARPFRCAGRAMTAGGIALREATFNDYEQIAAVQRRNGLRMKKHDYWLHLWQNNAAYQRRPGWPIGWVLENGQKQIVRSVNNIPLEYEFEGQRLTVSAGRGWAADPPYRGYSTLLMDEMFSQQGVDLFLNTTVNRLAAEAFGSSTVRRCRRANGTSQAIGSQTITASPKARWLTGDGAGPRGWHVIRRRWRSTCKIAWPGGSASRRQAWR